MAELTAQSAISGLPVTLGRATLTEFDPGPVTSIQPYPGRDLSAHLPFPAPGAVIPLGAARIVWAGRDTAFVIGGAVPGLTGLAAVTDQSDGWAWVTLSGPDAASVLARLCPLDLRPAAFAPETSARTLLNHLPVLLIRTTPEAFEIAAFRSMAGTLRHELTGAMRAVAARSALT